MLRFVSIQNLAVIEALDVEFEPGLNVLTGETGAGKSILVGAVGLLLGGRASPDLVRTGAEAATVQAVFERPDGVELLARREVTAQGRSRAFIDGSLVTAAALRDATADLVDLHGQHEHQALLDPRSHLDLLDTFAGVAALRQATFDAHVALRLTQERLASARAEERSRADRLDLIAFQLDEITRVAPRPGEDDELTSLRRVLASAEKLRRLCEEAYGLLYESDQAVLAGLGHVWKRVGELASIEPRFLPYFESRSSVTSQLDDLARMLRDYGETIEASPARLQQVEDRLAALERLKRKHGPSLTEVIARQRALAAEVEKLRTLDDRIRECELSVAGARSTYLEAARRLSAERHAASHPFSTRIEQELAQLAMSGTRVAIRFLPANSDGGEGSERGLEEAEFHVSPNLGEEIRPLARIASGGEISRLMLALKSIATTDVPGKTLIFDEVDSGIGGRVAAVVGARLRSLGERFQVLCITHLPQIAAAGTTHFRIEKHARAGRTVTSIARLTLPEREGELARMIGGSEQARGARASARELLAMARGESEHKAKGESEPSKSESLKRPAR